MRWNLQGFLGEIAKGSLISESYVKKAVSVDREECFRVAAVPLTYQPEERTKAQGFPKRVWESRKELLASVG